MPEDTSGGAAAPESSTAVQVMDDETFAEHIAAQHACADELETIAENARYAADPREPAALVARALAKWLRT